MEAHGMTIYRGDVPVARVYGDDGLQDGEWGEITKGVTNGRDVAPVGEEEAYQLAP